MKKGMKKQEYIKPEQEVVELRYSQMLCESVIPPGGDNEPPGIREFDDWDELDDLDLDV